MPRTMTSHWCIKYNKKPWRVLPEKLDGGASRFLKPLPYFRPKYKIFPTLFLTWSKIWYPISDLKPWSPAGDWSSWQGVTRLAETIKLLVLSPNDEEPASSKKLTQIKTIEYANHCRGQNTLQIMSLATDTSETNIKLTNSVTNQLRE